MCCVVMCHVLCCNVSCVVLQHDAANVIHVEAPHLHKVNTAIQLDPDTTADDIVARFKPSVPEVNGRSVQVTLLTAAVKTLQYQVKLDPQTTPSQCNTIVKAVEANRW